MTGRTATRACVGQTGELGGPGAGCEHDLRGAYARPIGERDPGDATAWPLHIDARDESMLAQLDPGELAGAPQRGQHAARIDAVILRRLQREAHRRCERRLQLTRGARQQPRGAQSERLAQDELALELACLVAVARDEQRAAAPQPERWRVGLRRTCEHDGLFQLGRELGPHLRRAQPQLEHAPPGVAELDLGDRCEHPGGDPRRAALPDRVALEDGDGHAALPRAPGDGEADDAAADDYNIDR